MVAVLRAGVVLAVTVAMSSCGVCVALSLNVANAPGSPSDGRAILRISRSAALLGAASGGLGMTGRLSGSGGILTAAGRLACRRMFWAATSTNNGAMTLIRLSVRSCVALQVVLLTIQPLFFSIPRGSVVAPFQMMLPIICNPLSALLGRAMPLYALAASPGATVKCA